jgi:peptidoglycan/xylan/chitin deacetylase (PgdA/CDA1 family)
MTPLPTYSRTQRAASGRRARVRRVLALVALLVLTAAVIGGCSLLEGGAGPTTTSISVSTTTTEAETTTTIPMATTTSRTATTTTTLPAEGEEIVRILTEDKVVALTFDAAYDPGPLPGIIQVLKDQGVPATFFLTGEFVEDFPESVRLIIEGDYVIGSHSYSHPYFTKIDDATIREELEKTETLLRKEGAPDPRPLFRPPYGDRNEHVLRVLAAEGYLSIFWTIDTIDWREGRTVEEIQNAVFSKLTPGAIVLMHVGGKNTAQALPGMIDELRSRGYGFVSLADL